MRRMAILGCSLLLVAGCGGGGSSDVEEMMQIDPAEPETGSMEPEPGSMEPEMSPTLVPTGQLYEEVVDGIYVSYNTTYFHRLGGMGRNTQRRLCIVYGYWLPATGRNDLYGVHQPRDRWGRQHDDARHAVGNLARDGERCLDRRCSGLRVGRCWLRREHRHNLPAVTGESQLEVDFTANIVDGFHELRLYRFACPGAGRTCLGTGLPWRTARSGMKPRA